MWCILGKNMLLFLMKTRRCSGAVPLFVDNAVYFPSRTCARSRNKYYCACFPPPSAYAEKICRVTYLFSSALRKNFEKRSKKSRVKVGVCEKVRNFAPAFERETR